MSSSKSNKNTYLNRNVIIIMIILLPFEHNINPDCLLWNAYIYTVIILYNYILLILDVGIQTLIFHLCN